MISFKALGVAFLATEVDCWPGSATVAPEMLSLVVVVKSALPLLREEGNPVPAVETAFNDPDIRADIGMVHRDDKRLLLIGIRVCIRIHYIRQLCAAKQKQGKDIRSRGDSVSRTGVSNGRVSSESVIGARKGPSDQGRKWQWNCRETSRMLPCSRVRGPAGIRISSVSPSRVWTTTDSLPNPQGQKWVSHGATLDVIPIPRAFLSPDLARRLTHGQNLVDIGPSMSLIWAKGWVRQPAGLDSSGRSLSLQSGSRSRPLHAVWTARHQRSPRRQWAVYSTARHSRYRT